MAKGYLKRLFCLLCGLYLALGFIPYFPLDNAYGSVLSSDKLCLANPTCATQLAGIMGTQTGAGTVGGTVIGNGVLRGLGTKTLFGMSAGAIQQAKIIAITYMCTNHPEICRKFTGRNANTTYMWQYYNTICNCWTNYEQQGFLSLWQPGPRHFITGWYNSGNWKSYVQIREKNNSNRSGGQNLIK